MKRWRVIVRDGEIARVGLNPWQPGGDDPQLADLTRRTNPFICVNAKDELHAWQQVRKYLAEQAK